MGNTCCKESTDEAANDAQPGIISNLGLNFSLDDWRDFHEQGSIQNNQLELENHATNLKKIKSFPKCLSRAVFICCNTYSNSDYLLGVGPMNDAIAVAAYMTKIGFNTYFLHNPRSTEFLKYFNDFIQKTTEYLVIYYIGHSSSINKKNEDETVIKDEVLIFDDNSLSDYEMISAINSSKKLESTKICFISDCCHSGSIYDLNVYKSLKIKIPPNVISFSSIRDSNTPKKTSIGGTDQGILTFFFYKLLAHDESMTPRKLESQISHYLERFQQKFIVCSTTDSLLDEAIFK